MLSFSGSLRVFVAVETCDMRKGFEGLSALVGSALNEEVKSGALFAFCNRRRTRLKILYFDGSGLWVLSKRLEKGTFAWPKPGDGIGGKLPLRAEALSMLMDGVICEGLRCAPGMSATKAYSTLDCLYLGMHPASLSKQ